ncbi:acetaldehyde dehydrogenase (acetylating) [Lacrimispora algidixylanolytica]|uniref:Acetaldehyde dehydrogenase (Acetylating) n=1 Tax=Lacrimispora algidixylanolytica TaxID=94868 RepID=A0A419TCF4_9FIRM|nr:acetaldehyde dehydrogenase (acetylating) [Lacrimispora algidixylanolytica]RKD35107.1 acetaldehyde dehydrogenase (acetylating) [Lacrimispora algidixylanolytica]
MENFDYDLRSIQEARDLARCGEAASKAIAKYTDEQIDAILRSMAKAGEEHALCLGEMAAEETGFGVAMDKAYKNHAASTLLYDQIKGMKTTGILSEDTVTRTIEVAEPVGLIMGIVPSTNPTSTVFFKSMIAIKSGNAIVFSPHPSAAKCTLKATEVMRNAAIAAGAPEGIISCVTMPSMGSTNELMKCKEVSIIIATGGPGMVKAAYSAGKPAIGVGAGNSPAYIEKTADVKHAVRTIMASKTFDYGTICASEQSIICEESNHAEVVSELKSQGGYFMTKEETDKVCNLLFKNGHNMNAKFVGRSPQVIAAAAGIQIPEGTRVLIGKQEGVGEGYPLSYEKLTTVLGFYTVKDWEEACGLSIRLLQNGIGHTMSIHTQDRDKVIKFAAKPASRILVNTGGSQGGTGISTGLPIAFTLGCGTCGGSSVSENVSPKHLINIKTVAYGLKDCSTIVEDDNTFMWKNGNTKTSSSPADFVSSFDKKETTPAASCQSGCDDNEKLAALVKEIVLAMKGQ